MVSIPGGEPLLHPQIDEIVRGLVARKKYIYLCTNALLLKEKICICSRRASTSHFQRPPRRPARTP
jgi:molybdenum cofactor biosynthesis enzyme MoaA